MRLSRVLRISRPRFWIYELGPYMIGVLGALLTIKNYVCWPDELCTYRWSTSDIFYENIVWILLYWFYFLIPANIWIYGINDIYDYETDKLNPKKVEWYEALVEPKEQKSLWKWILRTTIPFIIGVFLSRKIDYGSSFHVDDVIMFFAFIFFYFISFLAFLFFSWQYSAKPIRAKARPWLDSFFSAWHYIATAIFGYLLVNPTWQLNWYYIIAGMARAMAMHAFSAVPDIQADEDAKLATIATWLRWKATIRVCFGLYLLASFLSYSFLWRVSFLLGAAYCWLMLWAATLYWDDKKIFALYKRFPWINTISWMILFFVVLLKII